MEKPKKNGLTPLQSAIIKKIFEVFLEEWVKRERKASDNSINYAEQAIKKKQDMRPIKDKIKVLDSVLTIIMLEEDIEKLALEKASLSHYWLEKKRSRLI